MNKICLLMKKKSILISTIVCVFVLVLTSCGLTDHGGWGYFTPQKLFEKRFNIELPGNAKIIQYEWDDDENLAMGIIEVTEDYARELISTLEPVFTEVGEREYEVMSKWRLWIYYNLTYRKSDFEYMADFTCECGNNILTVVNQHNGTMLIYLC